MKYPLGVISTLEETDNIGIWEDEYLKISPPEIERRILTILRIQSVEVERLLPDS